MNDNHLSDDDVLQLILGELGTERQASTRNSVAEDAELAAIVRRLNAVVTAVRAENVSQVRDDFNKRLRQRTSEVFDHAQPETARPAFIARFLSTSKWIMRSPVSRAMTAAIFVLAVGGVAFWFHGEGTTPAYADFLQPFLDAKNVKYKMTTEMTSLPVRMIGLTPEMQKELMHTTAEVMQLDATRIRQESIMPGRSGKMVHVWDGVQRKSVYVYPSEKRANVINQDDVPGDETSREGLVGYAGIFRSALLNARNKPDVERESLGDKEIDGRRVVGFRIDKHEAEFRVWGDPQTGLPVLIELTVAIMPEMKVTMSDFVFNVDMDESLFTVEPPAGYEVKEQQASAPDDFPAKEKDLIEMFRYHSGFDGGRFPALLDMIWLGQTVHMQLWLADSLEQKPTLQHQEQEGPIAQAKIQRGLQFVTLLPKEADSHYAGRGISLGTADSPIFWYRPNGATGYRVIYADLSVRETETAPSVPDAQPGQLEKDLIQMFRQYCWLSSGLFPASLDVGSVYSVLTMKTAHGEPSAKQEAAECLVNLQRGLAFTGLLPEESNAYYAGKGVSLGAADKPIFWYRPTDAHAYRVIYADLSVREVETPPSVSDVLPEQDLIDLFRYYSQASGGTFPETLDITKMTQKLVGKEMGEEFAIELLLEAFALEKGTLNEERRHRIEQLAHDILDSQKLVPGEVKSIGGQLIEEQMLDLVDWQNLAPGEEELNYERKLEILEARIRKATETQMSKFQKAEMPKIMEITLRLQRGSVFLASLPPEADAHYAGINVTPGAAEAPVFWYRPRDGKKYRVIYADLVVGDAETPPIVPRSQPVPTQ